MPTALARPWPSGPVVVSTPGVSRTPDGPGVLRCSWRKRLQLLDRQVVAGQVQQRVEQHRAVAVRQHEAVAVRPVRVGRVVAQVAAPQRHGDLGHAHRHAGVAGIGLLHRVHRQRANGIGELGVGGFWRDGESIGSAQIILSDMQRTSLLAARSNYEHRVSLRSPGEGHWFVFRGDQLLVEMGPLDAAQRRPARARAARLGPAAVAEKPQLVGVRRRSDPISRASGRRALLGGRAARRAPRRPPGLSWEGLRTLFSVLDDAHFALAGRALQLVDWDRTHQFCGRCGARYRGKARGARARLPRLQAFGLPARGARGDGAGSGGENELLLARSPHFPPGMYSALAGFVEPGESLEQCLAREVAEEVGVQVSNMPLLRQPVVAVPAFADDRVRLRVGRAARSVRKKREIEEAKWFEVLQLPKLPSKISIARRLIDAVCREMIDKRRAKLTY